MAHQPQNPRGRNIAIDANALDPKEPAAESLVARFMAMHAAGELQQVTPYGVMVELERPRSPASVLARSLSGIFSLPVELTQREIRGRDAFRLALQGNASPGRHWADADHVFDADRSGCNYFITGDKRVLNSKPLRSLLGPHIQIVTLGHFIELWDGFNAVP
jgi:hypothetical protein